MLISISRNGLLSGGSGRSSDTSFCTANRSITRESVLVDGALASHSLQQRFSVLCLRGCPLEFLFSHRGLQFIHSLQEPTADDGRRGRPRRDGPGQETAGICRRADYESHSHRKEPRNPKAYRVGPPLALCKLNELQNAGPLSGLG